jgi:hypothetical protein
MGEVRYRNRNAAQVENGSVRVTVTVEGCHVAEILDKSTGVNPLWTPPWPSIEPSSYDPQRHPAYGADGEGQLLAGILGHSICLDLFGAPDPDERLAGIPVHGEAPVIPYQIAAGEDTIFAAASLPNAQLRFERRIRLSGDVVRFSETLENLSAVGRPIAWTQHVTLGPPFLEPGGTQFQVSATRSKVIGPEFNGGRGMQRSGADFDWPCCPLKDGGVADLRRFTAEPVSGGFTSHLMDPRREQAFFLAWSPSTRVLIGYVWARRDFPWLARWEENHLRTAPPWNSGALACGMEFGVSPLVESRREMVTRGSLFGAPTFGWAPARTALRVEYCAFVRPADSLPSDVHWDGEGTVALS